MSQYYPRFVPKNVDPSGLNCQEKAPCDDGDGGLDPDTAKVYHLCMALCKFSMGRVKDPSDFCKHCNSFPQPAKALCKHICKDVKKGVGWPDPIKVFCDKACCSGKLPEGMPGDKCIGEFVDSKGNPKKPDTGVKDCLQCCDDTFNDPGDPHNAIKKDNCKKTCTLMGQGY